MKDFFTIQSGDLRAMVLAPKSTLYNRTRFGQAGFVYGVSYKGVRFDAPESLIPGQGTQGQGLCSEYTLYEAEKEAKVGETYLRNGVGYVKRKEELLTIMSIEEFEPYPIEVIEEEDRLTFISTPKTINGYGYKETRVVTAKDNTLSIHVTLENTGEKTLHDNEYNHNFVSINGLPCGPKYKLHIPALAKVGLAENCGVIALPGGEMGITWEDKPRQYFFNLFDQIRPRDEYDYTWKLVHELTGASISETDDFSPEHITTWGVQQCICPEVFNEITVEPGQSASWTRTWHFTAE